MCWWKKSIYMQTLPHHDECIQKRVRISVFHLLLLLSFQKQMSRKRPQMYQRQLSLQKWPMTTIQQLLKVCGNYSVAETQAQCNAFTSFLRINAIRAFKVYQSSKWTVLRQRRYYFSKKKTWTLNCFIKYLIIFMSDWGEKWILDDDVGSRGKLV